MKVFTEEDVRALVDWAVVAVVLMAAVGFVVLFGAFILALAVRLFQGVM